ncbi:hypothetical protein LTR27_009034 [Elasticomyces elasticus]|nr:hypothetical protein LTR27_009034 [Elasticomyces elasticus]
MSGEKTESQEGDSLQQLLNAVNKILTNQSAIEALASWRVAESTDEPRLCRGEVREMAMLMDLKALAEVRHQFEIQVHRKTPDDDLPKQSGDAARTFFGTPELLELALLHLPVPDLLSAGATCHGFQNTITGSPMLRQRLFRDTAGGLPLRTPGLIGKYDYEHQWLGFPIRIGSRYAEWGGSNLRDLELLACFYAEFRSHDGKLPQLTERTLDMFVSQPPIKKVAYAGNCCGTIFAGHIEPGHAPIGHLSRPEGLRVRDLYTAAEVFLQQHRLCWSAPRRSLDDDGYARNIVVFEAKYDPPISKTDPYWKRFQVARVERTELDDRLDAYVRAKYYAHCIGDPIPTLEEYERLAIDDPEAYWKARAKPAIDPRGLE